MAHRAGEAPIRPYKFAFWLGLGLSILIKGPISLIVVAPAMLALSVWDRDIRWMKRLGWGWGLPLTALIVGPWAIAITIATDGGFWREAIMGDLGNKVVGAHEAAPELIAPAGVLGRHAPDASDRAAVRRCTDALAALGPFDAAQAAIAYDGGLVAVEGADGTDAMLRRLAAPNAMKRHPLAASGARRCVSGLATGVEARGGTRSIRRPPRLLEAGEAHGTESLTRDCGVSPARGGGDAAC
jgi:hypothetical protein